MPTTLSHTVCWRSVFADNGAAICSINCYTLNFPRLVFWVKTCAVIVDKNFCATRPTFYSIKSDVCKLSLCQRWSVALRGIFACIMKNKSVTWRPRDWWKYWALVWEARLTGLCMRTSSSDNKTCNYLHPRPIRHTALKQEDRNQSPMLIMRNIFFSASEKIISSWTEGSTGPF